MTEQRRTPDPDQPRASGGAVSIWRKILLTHQGYRELNRATHGAFGFNSAAKLLAWGGVCAIVLLLLHKVHEIQRELDPVGQGLEELRVELRSARSTVENGTQASGEELGALRLRAQQLAKVLDKASAQQKDDAAPALLRAQREAQDLADAIAKESDAFQSLAQQRAQLGKTLADFQVALQQQQLMAAAQAQAFADGGAAVEASLRALSDAAQKDTAMLSDAGGRLQLEQLTAHIDATLRSLAELEDRTEKASKALEAERAAKAAEGAHAAKPLVAASPPATPNE